MGDFQAAYLIALAVLSIPAWGRQRYALGWMWFNMVAMLAASLAMDLGMLNRVNATLTMMLVDFSTGVGLAMRSGMSRVIAWGYAVTIPIYAANVIWGVSLDAIWSIIYLIAVAQLGALCFGSLGHPGGGWRRPPARHVSMAAPLGNYPLPETVNSRYTDVDRVPR